MQFFLPPDFHRNKKERPVIPDPPAGGEGISQVPDCKREPRALAGSCEDPVAPVAAVGLVAVELDGDLGDPVSASRRIRDHGMQLGK